ncbi:MAG: FAD-dependent oxidoreductase [Actinobacteria bacterium]|nr:MAG: FAD-dependent oxidoreductase [Actinomycetota bacterium]
MKDIFRVSRMWRPRGELKKRYDVVVIGGGSHGLATAYYLAKNHGVKDVAVLEKSYIGSGASGRNTTIIRSNYRTPEGAAFYSRSVKLYEQLSADLDFNLMFSQHGHLTLAHSERAMVTMQERAEVNQLLGIDSRVVYPEEIARLCPQINLGPRQTWPIQGALYHAPGGIIRHDAVVWGLARGADRAGVEIHPYTEVTGIERTSGRATAVETNRGRVEADVVVSAVAGWSTLVCGLAGVRLPITTHILQAFVTEPVKPFLDVIIVSAQMHVYVSQTDRGEFLIGAEIEPYTTYKSIGTFPFLEYSARHTLELFPQLERLRVLRTWTGLCDLSPDYSPILGRTEVENFHVSAGWGTYGFKAAPIVGTTLAKLVATGETPDLIAPFALERFHTDELVSELAAAAVSH